MNEKLYELFKRSISGYPVGFKWFCELLKPENAHIISEFDCGKLIGYSIVCGNSITMLCVDEEYRKKGVGTRLLNASEHFIHANGGKKITIGAAEECMFQGVPTELSCAIEFFEKRGYTADWTSADMQICTADFDDTRLPPMPSGVEFRPYVSTDRELLLAAVNDAQSEWQSFFAESDDEIFLAMVGDEVAAFQILSDEDDRFYADNLRHGSIGCVGTAGKFRRRGIGLRMVGEGVKRLKQRGCATVDLYYVELVDWYAKLGFHTVRKQAMLQK